MLEQGIVNICPGLQGFLTEDIQHDTVNNAVKQAKRFGGENFHDTTQDVVIYLIDVHSEALTDDDFLELMNSVSEGEEAPDPEEE